MVHLKSLSKSFSGNTVIEEVSLEISAGERFILLGRSGCGKTTLLRLLAGFEKPDRGAILIDGKDVVPLPVERRPVGFIFQNHALFPHMSVYDNIAVGLRIRKTPEPEIARRIAEILEITRLTPLRDAYPGRLSGGESQRVAIARAIINRPKILLLDEPLSALDAGLRQSLREELREMQKTLGITFLFVTHDQEEAMGLAHRMGILEEGRLLQVGAPADLYNHPKSPFVAGFLGAVNRFSGKVERQNADHTVVALGGGVKINCEPRSDYPPGKAVSCFIRPEKMFFHSERTMGPSYNRVKALIAEKTFLGNQTQYQTKLENRQMCTVSVPHDSGQDKFTPLDTGDRVEILFSAKDVMQFKD
ncbi:MAG: polyamine-transporting ATPase [Nitrospinaceae bacterium]|nr:MAG: polyamine-transporting ATPase [Nitrospinaceae bacterium]